MNSAWTCKRPSRASRRDNWVFEIAEHFQPWTLGIKIQPTCDLIVRALRHELGVDLQASFARQPPRQLGVRDRGALPAVDAWYQNSAHLRSDRSSPAA